MKHKCRWVLMKGCPNPECNVKSVYDLCPYYVITKKRKKGEKK